MSFPPANGEFRRLKDVLPPDEAWAVAERVLAGSDLLTEAEGRCPNCGTLLVTDFKKARGWCSNLCRDVACHIPYSTRNLIDVLRAALLACDSAARASSSSQETSGRARGGVDAASLSEVVKSSHAGGSGLALALFGPPGTPLVPQDGRGRGWDHKLVREALAALGVPEEVCGATASAVLDCVTRCYDEARRYWLAMGEAQRRLAKVSRRIHDAMRDEGSEHHAAERWEDCQTTGCVLDRKAAGLPCGEPIRDGG